MSEKAALEFVGRLTLDVPFGEEFAAAVAGTAEAEYFSKAAAFAATRGFDVTPDELARFALPTGDGGELSDGELAKVAGGVGGILGPFARRPVPGSVNCGAANCAAMNCAATNCADADCAAC